MGLFKYNKSDTQDPGFIGIFCAICDNEIGYENCINCKTNEASHHPSEFNKGSEFYEDEDYLSAIPFFKAAADQGYEPASEKLANCYNRSDQSELAIPYWEICRKAGNHAANTNYAGYLKENNSQLDLAMQLWRGAAVAGIPQAAFNLGVWLKNLNQPEEAKELLAQAGLLGYMNGYYVLAGMYYKEKQWDQMKSALAPLVADGDQRATTMLNAMNEQFVGSSDLVINDNEDVGFDLRSSNMVVKFETWEEFNDYVLTATSAQLHELAVKHADCWLDFDSCDEDTMLWEETEDWGELIPTRVLGAPNASTETLIFSLECGAETWMRARRSGFVMDSPAITTEILLMIPVDDLIDDAWSSKQLFLHPKSTLEVLLHVIQSCPADSLIAWYVRDAELDGGDLAALNKFRVETIQKMESKWQEVSLSGRTPTEEEQSLFSWAIGMNEEVSNEEND